MFFDSVNLFKFRRTFNDFTSAVEVTQIAANYIRNTQLHILNQNRYWPVSIVTAMRE